MDRPTRGRLIGAALLAALVGVAAPLTAQQPMQGTFALIGGTQRVQARMQISRPRPNELSLDVVQSSAPDGPPIRAYASDMTKLMHMIVISDDFRTFAHVHPVYNATTGHFKETTTVDPAHRYYVYVDSEPQSVGQQVFRFAVAPLSGRSGTPNPSQTPSPPKVHAGPYTVTLATTTPQAGDMAMIDVKIDRNGKPATDLRPYLGAAAHAVFIDTATLGYLHVHPEIYGEMTTMDMSGRTPAKASPHLLLHVGMLPVGTYKLWLEFQGGSSLYVAPFTIVAR